MKGFPVLKIFGEREMKMIIERSFNFSAFEFHKLNHWYHSITEYIFKYQKQEKDKRPNSILTESFFILYYMLGKTLFWNFLIIPQEIPYLHYITYFFIRKQVVPVIPLVNGENPMTFLPVCIVGATQVHVTFDRCFLPVLLGWCWGFNSLLELTILIDLHHWSIPHNS